MVAIKWQHLCFQMFITIYLFISNQCWGGMEHMYWCYVFKIQNTSNCILLQLPFKSVIVRVQLLC